MFSFQLLNQLADFHSIGYAIEAHPNFILFYFLVSVTTTWWRKDKGKGKVVPELNKVPHHKDISCTWTKHIMKMYGGVEGIAPHILYLGAKWGWVFSFTPRLLYPWGKSLWYPLDRRLSGPQIHKHVRC